MPGQGTRYIMQKDELGNQKIILLEEKNIDSDQIRENTRTPPNQIVPADSIPGRRKLAPRPLSITPTSSSGSPGYTRVVTVGPKGETVTLLPKKVSILNKDGKISADSPLLHALQAKDFAGFPQRSIVPKKENTILKPIGTASNTLPPLKDQEMPDFERLIPSSSIKAGTNVSNPTTKVMIRKNPVTNKLALVTPQTSSASAIKTVRSSSTGTIMQICAGPDGKLEIIKVPGPRAPGSQEVKVLNTSVAPIKMLSPSQSASSVLKQKNTVPAVTVKQETIVLDDSSESEPVKVEKHDSVVTVSETIQEPVKRIIHTVQQTPKTITDAQNSGNSLLKVVKTEQNPQGQVIRTLKTQQSSIVEHQPQQVTPQKINNTEPKWVVQNSTPSSQPRSNLQQVLIRTPQGDFWGTVQVDDHKDTVSTDSEKRTSDVSVQQQVVQTAVKPIEISPSGTNIAAKGLLQKIKQIQGGLNVQVQGADKCIQKTLVQNPAINPMIKQPSPSTVNQIIRQDVTSDVTEQSPVVPQVANQPNVTPTSQNKLSPLSNKISNSELPFTHDIQLFQPKEKALPPGRYIKVVKSGQTQLLRLPPGTDLEKGQAIAKLIQKGQLEVDGSGSLASPAQNTQSAVRNQIDMNSLSSQESQIPASPQVKQVNIQQAPSGIQKVSMNNIPGMISPSVSSSPMQEFVLAPKAKNTVVKVNHQDAVKRIIMANNSTMSVSPTTCTTTGNFASGSNLYTLAPLVKKEQEPAILTSSRTVVTNGQTMELNGTTKTEVKIESVPVSHLIAAGSSITSQTINSNNSYLQKTVLNTAGDNVKSLLQTKSHNKDATPISLLAGSPLKRKLESTSDGDHLAVTEVPSKIQKVNENLSSEEQANMCEIPTVVANLNRNNIDLAS